MLTLRKVLPTLNTLLLYSPNYQPFSSLLLLPDSRFEKDTVAFNATSQERFLFQKGDNRSSVVRHCCPTVAFHFHFNYTDDRKEDNSSITSVIAQYLLSLYVLLVFYSIFYEEQLTSHVLLNKIQCLLTLFFITVQWKGISSWLTVSLDSLMLWLSGHLKFNP